MHLDLVLSLAAGEPVAGKGITSIAKGLRPGSAVALELHSTPRILQTVVADARGYATFDVSMPGDIEPGLHMLVLKGTTPAGVPVSSVAAFTVGANGIIESVAPSSERMTSALPAEADVLRAISSGRALYDLDANAGTVLALAAAASILGAAVGSGSRGSGSGSSGGSDRRGPLEGERFDRRASGGPGGQSESVSTQADLAGLEADSLATVSDTAIGWGDHRATWTMPGHAQWHAVLRGGVSAFERRSAVLARVLCDGQWIRAAFGSFDVVVCLAGGVLGVVAAQQVGFAALAPPWALIVAMVLLSMANALSGLVAGSVFLVSVMLGGGATTLFDVRTLLGLIVLIMGPPLLANAIRPLRRPVSGQNMFDRMSDYLIMPLFLAYGAGSMYTALNGLSGLQLVTQADAIGLRNAVFVAAIVRLIAEDAVVSLYPRRSREVSLSPQSEPGTGVKLATQVLRVAILAVLMVPFFGAGWRTWVIIALSVAVPLAGIFSDRLPDFSSVRKWTPRGIVRSVMMIFVCAWFGTWIAGLSNDPGYVRSVAVLLMLPGLIVGCIDLVVRTGGAWPDAWWKRAGGTVLWGFSAAVLTGLVAI